MIHRPKFKHALRPDGLFDQIEQGRKAGSKEGRKAGRQAGMQAGRQEAGRKEGRKEEGRKKEGRKETTAGRNQGWQKETTRDQKEHK